MTRTTMNGYLQTSHHVFLRHMPLALHFAHCKILGLDISKLGDMETGITAQSSYLIL